MAAIDCLAVVSTMLSKFRPTELSSAKALAWRVLRCRRRLGATVLSIWRAAGVDAEGLVGIDDEADDPGLECEGR